MFTIIFLFVLGFVLLLKGAEWLVNGSTSLAKHLNMSALIIGMTIVAIGTSTPEFFVSLLSGLSGNSDIAIGTILGSNISNILLILGIASVIYPIKFKSITVKREIPLSLLAVMTLVLLTGFEMFNLKSSPVISQNDGMILLVLFVLFLFYTLKTKKMVLSEPDNEVVAYSKTKSWLMIMLGIIGLAIGGKLIVNGVINIASMLGIGTSVLALSIVAVGTSLPELATSVVAACKKNSDIAVGNIIGSNIFNIFLIIGASASVKALPFPRLLIPDLLIVILATLLLFIFMFIGKRYVLQRWQGVVFILSYIIYLVFLVLRH